MIDLSVDQTYASAMLLPDPKIDGLRAPTDVAFHPQIARLLVTDGSHVSALNFDNSPAMIERWATGFSCAFGIAVNERGHVLVTDADAHVAREFEVRDGRAVELRRWGSGERGNANGP